jgi:hypothetical protein
MGRHASHPRGRYRSHLDRCLHLATTLPQKEGPPVHPRSEAIRFRVSSILGPWLFRTQRCSSSLTTNRGPRRKGLLHARRYSCRSGEGRGEEKEQVDVQVTDVMLCHFLVFLPVFTRAIGLGSGVFVFFSGVLIFFHSFVSHKVFVFGFLTAVQVYRITPFCL